MSASKAIGQQSTSRINHRKNLPMAGNTYSSALVV